MALQSLKTILGAKDQSPNASVVQTSSFLTKLPVEIRLRIYELAIRNEIHDIQDILIPVTRGTSGTEYFREACKSLVTGNRFRSGLSGPNSSLFYTCRQVYNEVRWMFPSNVRTVALTDLTGISNFVALSCPLVPKDRIQHADVVMGRHFFPMSVVLLNRVLPSLKTIWVLASVVMEPAQASTLAPTHEMARMLHNSSPAYRRDMALEVLARCRPHPLGVKNMLEKLAESPNNPTLCFHWSLMIEIGPPDSEDQIEAGVSNQASHPI